LVFLFSFLVSLLVLCLSGDSLLVADFPGLDSSLPFDEIDELLLFPELFLFMMILVPEKFIAFFDLGDVGFELF
jgi:hypothetical protein